MQLCIRVMRGELWRGRERDVVLIDVDDHVVERVMKIEIENGTFKLIDQATWEQEKQGELKEIFRDGNQVFQGDTQISQMKRTHAELVHYLTMEMSFPHGVFLMTGTCIVPDPPFTLQSGDEIFITIEPIGTLKNIVL